MTTKDIRSNNLPQRAFRGVISTNTTTNGDIIDTRGSNAIMFTLLAAAYTDGTYTPSFQEGDDSGLSDAATVPAARLIGTPAGAVVNSLAGASANLKSVGVLSSKRYLRMNIASTSVTTGATIVGVAHKRVDVMPATGLSA